MAASSTTGRSADRPSVPTSTGPLTGLARLTISAPTTGRPGDKVPVSARLEIFADGPRIITTPATSAVLLVRGRRVVGRSDPATSAADIPLVVRAGSRRVAQAVPGTVRLIGRTAHAGDLPAGDYALIGVLGYRLDPLNAAVDGGPLRPHGFSLVSDPALIYLRGIDPK